jgi:VWFA-related protein
MPPICRRLIALSVVAASASIHAQDASRPSYRVGSELVVVDLVATDRSGGQVADLQPSEIQIFENGKTQKIQFVHLVRGAASVDRETSPAAGPATARPATAAAPDSSASSPPGARVAIVLDLGSMPADALPRVRETLLQLVRDEVPNGTAVMLATLSPAVTIRQPFTTDRAAAIAAIEGLPLSFSGGLTVMEIVQQVESACDLGGVEGLRDAAVAVARSLAAETKRRLAAASSALATLSRALAPLPGRKHIVLYSAGYLTNPVSDAIEVVSASVSGCTGADTAAVQRAIAQDLAANADDDALGRIQTAIDRANRSQVSFYAIDPRGLVTTNVQAQQRGSARMARGGVFQKVQTLDQTRSQQYLHSVAAATGGRTFLNTNDLAAGLRRAWRDASEYYLIGYTPSGSRKKGQFQKIEVKVARPDLDLRYRRGYYEATEQELARKDVESALRDPSSFAHEGFDVETRVEDGKLWVITFIPPTAIRFTTDGDAQKADFSVHATLRDGHGKLVGGKPIIGRDLGVRLSPDRVADLLSSGSKVEVRTDVKPPAPGAYQLVVVARDSSGWIAARALDVTVTK